jgi:hypothetical protein
MAIRCHSERIFKTESEKSEQKKKSNAIKQRAPAKRPAESKNKAVTKAAFDLWGDQGMF